MTFGERLAMLREAKKITQVELAELTKISRSRISLYEIDKREPDIETIKQLADFFGVTTDYLLGHTAPLPPDPNAEAIATIDDALIDYPELLAFWEETKKRPDLQIFLKQVKTASPRLIRQMIALIKATEEEEDREG